MPVTAKLYFVALCYITISNSTNFTLELTADWLFPPET
jgi:hypothetical protein